MFTKELPLSLFIHGWSALTAMGIIWDYNPIPDITDNLIISIFVPSKLSSKCESLIFSFLINRLGWPNVKPIREYE